MQVDYVVAVDEADFQAVMSRPGKSPKLKFQRFQVQSVKSSTLKLKLLLLSLTGIVCTQREDCATVIKIRGHRARESKECKKVCIG